MFDKEIKIVSRTAKLYTHASTVYRTISDFSLFNKVIPPDDRIKVERCNADECYLVLGDNVNFGMRIVERQENETVKIMNCEGVPFEFKLWIQLKEKQYNETYLRITFHATMNPLLKMMMQKKFTSMIDNMVDQLEQRFSASNASYN